MHVCMYVSACDVPVTDAITAEGVRIKPKVICKVKTERKIEDEAWENICKCGTSDYIVSFKKS